MKAARRQRELDVANKRAVKTVKTLSPPISEMEENSVSVEMVLLYRSALGDQTGQSEQLTTHTLDALKERVSSPKNNRG